ncbi:argininosuccinate lyase [Amycolatopsis jiangsuensis]|uniref:argininosuccinate lyase n=1 Tax=Amycolatopsis jiangsuensis TaxID=1181879 RepID=A0A840IN27_9PSEU|nr:argininosuccinate lyase [Amycolatopsis jiangsuensis]MBB4683756.1 argininosuccinate lyase [Amycolatopsis jiangsuensis]
MTDTGRLKAGLGRRTGSLVFGTSRQHDIAPELELSTTVDLAHVVMLARQGLLDGLAAAELLRLITRLREGNFAEVAGRPAPRGLYLMYEDFLVAELGARTGGMLHTGRSRNDLKAACTALRLGRWVREAGEQAVRLQAVLLNRARTFWDAVMPVHTHFQPAMPITYGYYLAGIAQLLGRDLAALRQAVDGLDRCPMGAGAVAGTDLPIDPAAVARLLGFARPAGHALDAVASRDVPLRVLGAVAGLGVTLSRLATDLQLWSSAEFGFVTFPERLVGGSSAMPQKRNAFLLEHLKAKAGHAIGAWTAAASTMKSTPFTNSIETGTEAVAAIWPGLDAVAEGVLLAQVVASGARPMPDRMRASAERGFVTATALANDLVRAGVPFRAAHHLVGAAVRAALERGGSAVEAADLPQDHRAAVSGRSYDVAAAAEAASFGGGPGAFDEVFAEACRDWSEHRSWLAAARTAQQTAREELDMAVAAMMNGETAK